MAIDIDPYLTAAPFAAWATATQFRCNESTRCGGSPCPDGYVSPWEDSTWLDWSTSLLFHLTGSRFTSTTVTVIPPATCTCTSSRWTDPNFDPCNPCTDCGRYPAIDLFGDVLGITSVTVDGVAVDDSLYRVDHNRWLVRTADPDGTNPGWGLNHRYDTTTGDLSFVVTYTSGASLPAGAPVACVALACALRQMSEGPGDWSLMPGQRVVKTGTTAVTAKGAASQLQNLMTNLRNGKTGIGPVDAFLSVWRIRLDDNNGNDIAPGGWCWSPDLEEETPKRVTWQA